MEAAEAAGITDRGARRWMKRWREEGERGLLDRSSAPHRIPHKTPPTRVRAIVRLRRLRQFAGGYLFPYDAQETALLSAIEVANGLNGGSTPRGDALLASV
jgi:hypothetical protein